MDIVSGELGPEASYDVDFQDGNVVVKLKHVGAQGEVELSAKVGLIEILEKAAAKSDNKIDDQAVAFIKGLLG